MATSRYKFALEATFVTQVPMPVVTVDPMVVNLDNLELEAQLLGGTSFSYSVTNHGLIRADGFDLELPSSHPFLVFSYDAPIGDIEPNTTVVVPITVTLRDGSSRRSSSGCHTGVASYSVECGGTRCTYPKSANWSLLRLGLAEISQFPFFLCCKRSHNPCA